MKLELFKSCLESLVAIEQRQNELEQRLTTIELTLENISVKDDERLNSHQIQELETLFKQIFLNSQNGQQVRKIKDVLVTTFLKCPASSCTYKDIAQKHYPACKKIVSAFL